MRLVSGFVLRTIASKWHLVSLEFFLLSSSSIISIPRNHKSLDIATITRWSSSFSGLSLSCRLKLDSSNPSTSTNTNMCSEWSLNPRIAIEMSEHTACNSALSGLRFSISILRFGADMITSYFPSESNATIAYTNFSPSGRCAYPGDSANTALGVIFGNAPSFSVSIISPIGSRMFFIAGHTVSSTVVGSLSLLRKRLLCRWSFMPANTIVIGFISVCRCIPIVIDTDCIRSRSSAANNTTSGQNRYLAVCTKSQFATIRIFAFLISTLSYAAKIVSSSLIIFIPPYFLT